MRTIHVRMRIRSVAAKILDRTLRSDFAALGAAGVAAAGLAAEGERRHRRDKETSEEGSTLASPRKPHHVAAEPPESSSRGEENDEERRERRRRRRELRDQDERRHSDTGLPLRQGGAVDAEYDRHRRDRLDPHDNTSRRRERHRSGHDENESDTTEDEDRQAQKYRPSALRVVSPAKEPEKKLEAAKPKGILRPPREKFPEDPAPIREGVAPLKDAGKKGIPPSARWTKIDRRLVNPEALELGNERFEERVEYVIVLRVLSKEEIEKYAEITAKIRGTFLAFRLSLH